MAKSVDRTRDLQPIIDRMVAGDETAVPALIDRSCERLRKLTRKMLKSCPGVKPWEDTDDVLQGAAIRLHRSLEAVKPATVQAFFGLAAVQIRRQLIDLFRHYHGPEGEAKNRADEVPNGKSRQRVIRDKADNSAGRFKRQEGLSFVSNRSPD